MKFVVCGLRRPASWVKRKKFDHLHSKIHIKKETIINKSVLNYLLKLGLNIWSYVDGCFSITDCHCLH